VVLRGQGSGCRYFALSGGEKAMTALALLIAIFRYQRARSVFGRVDAPLDEANVGGLYAAWSAR